jgi:hypothetical protein
MIRISDLGSRISELLSLQKSRTRCYVWLTDFLPCPLDFLSFFWAPREKGLRCPAHNVWVPCIYFASTLLLPSASVLKLYIIRFVVERFSKPSLRSTGSCQSRSLSLDNMMAPLSDNFADISSRSFTGNHLPTHHLPRCLSASNLICLAWACLLPPKTLVQTGIGRLPTLP